MKRHLKQLLQHLVKISWNIVIIIGMKMLIFRSADRKGLLYTFGNFSLLWQNFACIFC